MQRFRSKIDGWVLALIAATIFIMAWVAFDVATSALTGGTSWWALVVVIASEAMLVWMLVSTYYEVDDQDLRVVAGPLRWRIPLDAIDSIVATRSLFSAPALSLDRLRIYYGDNRNIMVSPGDRVGFLRAIGHSTTDAMQ